MKRRIASLCLFALISLAPLSESLSAQQAACCEDEEVKLVSIEKIFHRYTDPVDPGISAPNDTEIVTTTQFPAVLEKTDPHCKIKFPGAAPYYWAGHKTTFNISGISDPTVIKHGDSITITADFEHLGGAPYIGAGPEGGEPGYTFDIEHVLLDAQGNPVTSSPYNAHDEEHIYGPTGVTSVNLSATAVFDFHQHTTEFRDANDNLLYREFKIRAIAQQANMQGHVEFLEIVATYHCYPNNYGPGPCVTPIFEPPIVCDGCNCPIGISQGGATTVNPLVELQSHGLLTDAMIYSRPGSSGCSSCASSAGSSFDVPNSLLIQRKLLPANQVAIGNSSPGMYFVELDARIIFYVDSSGDHCAIFFDPWSGKTILLTDTGSTGTYVSSNSLFGDLLLVDASGNPATTPADGKTATIFTRNCWKYEFEITPTPLCTYEYGARLVKLISPEGFEKTFTYKAFSQAAIDSSPTRQFQIDTITDPSGNVAAVSYHPSPKAARWAISEININTNMISLTYDYNVDGHLETVKRRHGPSGTYTTLSEYTYGTDTLWDAAYIKWKEHQWNNPQAYDRIYISSDYLLWEGELVNQFANNLVGRADGKGDRYMVVARDDTVPGLFRVEYRGMLAQWQQGEYWRYFETWTQTGSGYDGYSGSLESSYDHHPGITAAQIDVAQPPTLVDETGLSVAATYDAEGNIYRKTYADTSYEQWLYDSKNRVKYYRDRAGYVTLTERDTRGNVVRVTRGHLDSDGDGTAVAQPGAIQQIYGYYSSGANEGLLQWSATNAYAAGAVAAPPANERTDYEYNGTNQLTKVIKPLPEGETTRPEVTYIWTNGLVFSMNDEVGGTTTYSYDDFGRLIETLYPDGTTSQVRYHSPIYIYRKNRNNVVQMELYDDAGRLKMIQPNFANDSNIVTSGVSGVNPGYTRSVRIRSYIAGQTSIYLTKNENVPVYHTYDYRGRLIRTRVYPRHVQALKTEHTYVDNMLLKTTELTHNYSRTTYNGYSTDRLTVRKIMTRDPSISFADNKSVMLATRVSGTDPAHTIADAVRDLRGNLVQVIDGRGTITMNTFDALGRQTQTVRGHGLPIALTSSTEYDGKGRVDKTIDPAGMETKTVYDDAGNVKSRTQAFGTPLALTTSYTYDAKGRQKTVTSPSGGVNTTHYHDCCGNISASEDPYGDGNLRVANAEGQTVYQAQLKDFDYTNGNYTDPPAANTLGSTTTRYDGLGRVLFTTRWKAPLGQIDPANPPIAGLDGVPIADGVTTQTVHFLRIYLSGSYVSSYNSQTVNRLGGGTAVIDLTPALVQLAETPANGGASTSFGNGSGSNSNGKATATISPDEKTVSFSLVDGPGRTVMTGLMTGPAATTPNQLINWTCTQFDQDYQLTGFGEVERINRIDRDGNMISSLTDGFGWRIGSLDQDDNLTRNKFDEGGSVKERIDRNGNSMSYTYDDLGRQLTTVMPHGTTTTNYNATNGRVDSRVDAKSKTTSYQYDILGRNTITTDRMNKNTIRTYDSAGRLFTLTDAESRTTEYLYDLLSRKTSTEYPDGSINTISYDVAGYDNAQRFTFDSGKSITSVTSFDGTLDKIEFRDTSGTLAGTDDYSYDDQLRRDGSTSMDGVVRALTYNENGQLETDTTTYGGQSYAVTYGYDNQLRQDSITYPSGRIASYTFTNRGELDTINWAGTQIEDRLYDAGGRLTNIDRAFTDEVRIYDNGNRLTSIDNTNVGTATYTWDANSNKQSETWTGALASHSFTTEKAGASQYANGYDEEDRFRRFNQSAQSSDIYLARSDIGNINDVQINSTSHTRSFSPAHELTNVDGVAQTFDDDGNLTLSHNGITVNWDAANRLGQTVVPSTATAGIEGTNDYGYDSENKRVFKKVTRNGSTAEHTVYIYAGPNCIAEYDSGTAATSPEKEYVYGQQIDSLVLQSRNNDVDRSIVTRNQQWSVAALLDASDGSVQERYTYDHFGKRKILAPDGTTVRTSSSYNMPYGYTSRRHDAESDLMYFRTRYLDPTTGEFASRDPLEYVDGMSMTRGYMGLSGADPFGRDLIRPTWPPPANDPNGDVLNIGGELFPFCPVKQKKFLILSTLEFKRRHNGKDFYHKNLGELLDNARKLVDPRTEEISRLEIEGHGSYETLWLGGFNSKNTTATLEATVITPDNAAFVATQIATLPFACPCTIYLSGCNTGIGKGNNVFPQILADHSGCTVMATGGYMAGTVFDGTASITKYKYNVWENWCDYFDCGTRKRDCAKYFASENDVWYRFSPNRTRRCKLRNCCPPKPTGR